MHSSEEKFRRIFETAPDGIILLEAPTGKITDTNPYIEKLLGYSHRELIGKKLWKIGPFKNVFTSQGALRRIQREGPIRYEELPLETKDGNRCVVEFVSNVYRVGNQKVIQCHVRDMSERAPVERGLKESEACYRSLFENLLDGFAYCQMLHQQGEPQDFIYLAVNPAFEKLTGLKNVVGKKVTEVIPRIRESDPALFEIYGRVALTGRSEQFEMYLESLGTWFSISVHSTQKEYFTAVFENITQRKQAEESLLQSEERYRSLFEDSPISLWEEDFSAVKRSIEDLRKQGVTDFRAYFESHPAMVLDCMRQVKIVEVNKATLKLFGAKNKKEIINNLGLILGEAIEDLQEELVNIAEGMSEFEWQGINHTLSGEPRVISLHWSAAQGHEETLDKILLSMRDITERKRNEEQIRSLSKFPAEDPNPVLRISADGVLLYANQSSEPLLAMWKIRIGQAMPAEWQTWNAGVFSSGKNREVEIKYGERVFLCILAPVTEAGYVNVYGREITKRKKAEEELHGVNRALRTLSLCNQAVVHASEESSLLESVCRILVEQSGYRLAWVGLADQDEQKKVRPVAQAGYEQGYLENLHLTWADEERGRGPAGTAIRTASPVIARDIATDPNFAPWRQQALERGFASAIALPLGSENTQPLGTLCIYAAEPNAFNAEEIQLLTQLANDLGYGIESLRTREAHRRGQEQLERQLVRLESLRTIDTTIAASLDLGLTLNVLLDQVTNQLKVDAADVLLLNPHSQFLEHVAARGFRTEALKHTRLRLGEGYAGQAALNRSPVRIPALSDAPDGLRRAPLLLAEGFAAYYAIPLIAKGKIKGVLEIFHRLPLEPDREWEEFLKILAGQAALAIDAAELFMDLQRSNLDLSLAYDATIEGWSRALDLRDNETEGHTQRVTEMAESLARAFGVEGEALVHVRRGALLHDIGKMGVPDSILLKPGPLTEEERGFMRKHPTLAYEMLSPIAYLKLAVDIPYCHHEKWDGTGYPRGLKGEEIPLSARIFAIVDVWDALRSDRPYRPAWVEERVLEYIREQKGKHFDPRVVEAFLRLLKEPEGTSS
ncbi:MAG: PAS domain S-box protein [Anaerolineales bacterium]